MKVKKETQRQIRTKKDRVLEYELRMSKLMKQDWKRDNGETFECRCCSKVRPVSLKSKTKIGKCRLCTGGD